MLTELPLIDVVGFWLGIFLTFCILSFLYKDNPFYKFAEHLFVGVSLGYVIITQWEDVMEVKLIDRLDEGWWKLIALLLVILMFAKAASRKLSWVGRFPIALVVGLVAGIQINSVVQSELGVQIQFAAQPIIHEKIDLNHASPEEIGAIPGMSPAIARKLAGEREQRPFASVDDAMSRPSLTAEERTSLAEERGELVGVDARAAVGPGEVDWFGVVSNLLLLLGLLSSLLYFYFSAAHTGVVGRVSRFGVWVIMIGFGASFGFTVQGRIALAIGRAQEVLGKNLERADADQVRAPWVSVISVAIIVIGIALWELREKRRRASASGPGTAQ